MAYFSKVIQILVFVYCASPTTPYQPKLIWFGLFHVRSPLLMESLIVFFSSGYLDVSVPQVSFPTIYKGYLTQGKVGCPIQKFADHFVQTNPRNLSQFTTSFVASKSQGILHTPFVISYLLLKLEYGKHSKKRALAYPLFAFTISQRTLTSLQK